MKKIAIPFFLFFVLICAGTRYAKAQDISSDPGAYMNAINSSETDMNKSYMAYISASAHSSRKRKIEKLRNKAVDNIVICQNTLTGLPAYKGDNTLRQNAIAYTQLCYKIFNEDYAHIVNMEDISEQSVDEMQAYLLLMEATNDTLKVGNDRMNKAEKTFAKKYNVNLLEQKSELGEKMEATGRLSKYRDKVFIVFFKCNWEDNKLTEAVNEKNVTKIEQIKSALDKYAVQGLKVLDTLQGFENDGSLADACKQALNFYKTEAETQVALLTDYFLKEESFTKFKTTMDAKPANERTQKDVDTYNKGVSDINTAVNTYNQTNTDLNNGRNEVNNNWTNTEKQFLDMHTPYYK